MGIHMKLTYTTQNVLRMILDDLRGSHMFSDVFIIFSVFEGCSPKKAPKSPWVLQIWCGYFLSPLGPIVLQGISKKLSICWFGQRAKTCWDVPDKMPTKNWDGQNANHRKKSVQNANLWLAFCPNGILSNHQQFSDIMIMLSILDT